MTKIIGQSKLLSSINVLIEEFMNFPRFTILVGPSGSGKKLLADYIAKELGCIKYSCEVSVESIRSMIADAKKTTTPTAYIIPDVDKMSPAARNALLKVTEEPPHNAYFIATTPDENGVSPTIRSRGAVYHMLPYSFEELQEFASSRLNIDLDEQTNYLIREICAVPGDVKELFGSGVHTATEFYKYVEKVVDNIAAVSGSNSFKIANAIRLKESDFDKYDLTLFWRAFAAVCLNRAKQTNDSSMLDYLYGMIITSNYLHDLRIRGVNKASTFDMWLLDIREAWM